MHVYNAIVVLKEILPVFPLATVATVGDELNKAVDKLLEREQRGDLKILGKAYVLNFYGLWMLLKHSPATRPVSRSESTYGQYPSLAQR
jgi:hypothetical protein